MGGELRTWLAWDRRSLEDRRSLPIPDCQTDLKLELAALPGFSFMSGTALGQRSSPQPRL